MVANDPFPRILVVDITRRQDGSATGALKETLFAGWPAENYLQVHATPSGSLALSGAPSIMARLAGPVDDRLALELAQVYAPQLLLYRPVPDPTPFHMAAMGLISLLPVPLAVWIMDDWPAALAAVRPTLAAAFDRDLRDLLARAVLRLGIGEDMVNAFQERYGVPFQSFGNGVQLTQWPNPSPARDLGNFTLRYGGSLAADMTLSALLSVARAVERLADAGLSCRLEINTRPLWLGQAGPIFAGLKATAVTAVERDEQTYRQWLADADAVVLAYNADPLSRIYCRYSVANKLPELLACGAPILAVGPRGNATLGMIADSGCGFVIDAGDVGGIGRALAGFIADADGRRRLVSAARDLAATRFDIDHIRANFTSTLTTAAGPAPLPHAVLSDTHPREAGAHLDETELVAVLSDNWTGGRERVMLDVGAHFGGSSQYFVDRGWRCHCFEPDVRNRETLAARFQEQARVTIHPVALGEAAMEAASFFRSPESTGISSLLPFRDSHEQTGQVPVTTLDLFTSTHGIDHVDFLKIDAEGWDLMVLRGVPWERLHPSVIVCEFEDAKTGRLGYRMQDVATYLTDRGYTVLVSEWHPVIRYGITHQWCRLARYPTALRDPTGWGNLLAFRKEPDPATLNTALDLCLRVDNPAAIIPTRPLPSPIGFVTTAIDLLSLPADRKVWIYGASTGGRLVHDLLRRQERLRVAGFLDSLREGEHCGLPVRRPGPDLCEDRILVASQYAREIIATLRGAGTGPVHDASCLVQRLVEELKGDA